MPDTLTPFNTKLHSKPTDLEAHITYLIGVAIFRPALSPSTSDPYKLLIVKRSSHEDVYPNNWELPGGHVEPGESVKECVERETMEETGLVVDRIIGEFDELRWTSQSQGRVSVQYNYAVRVAEPMDVQLNPEEHTEHKWITEMDVDRLQMSSGMNKVLHDAFTFSRTNAAVL
jgi:8-oxo-dGTP pyrophosphatase MutT (NUDIX family)